MNGPEIKEMLLVPNQFSRPGIPMQTVQAVVIHYIGNPNTSAIGNRTYFQGLAAQNALDDRPDTYSSSHYIIGLRGEILRLIPETEAAYHAGGRRYTELAAKLFHDEKRGRVFPHDRCVGIEVCHPTIAGDFLPATMRSLIDLTIDIANRHGLGIDRVLRHHDVTGKICPRWFVEEPEAWAEFLDEVRKGLKTAKGPAPKKAA
jgi:N-acetylmuramoyl-L-alanine amidase CwlA